MQPKTDLVYVVHMLESIERIEQYAIDGQTGFLSSAMQQDAVLRNLQVLAESSQRLSGSLKASNPEVNWRAISGFRNVLVHDYLGIDIDLIWLVVANDLPILKKALDTMRKTLD
jgi:uncharacterized protein with HEPN domain